MYRSTGLMGQGRREVDKQGAQKPGYQNKYGTKNARQESSGREHTNRVDNQKSNQTYNYNKQIIHKTGDYWRRGTE